MMFRNLVMFSLWIILLATVSVYAEPLILEQSGWRVKAAYEPFDAKCMYQGLLYTDNIFLSKNVFLRTVELITLDKDTLLFNNYIPNPSGLLSQIEAFNYTVPTTYMMQGFVRKNKLGEYKCAFMIYEEPYTYTFSSLLGSNKVNRSCEVIELYEICSADMVAQKIPRGMISQFNRDSCPLGWTDVRSVFEENSRSINLLGEGQPNMFLPITCVKQ